MDKMKKTFIKMDSRTIPNNMCERSSCPMGHIVYIEEKDRGVCDSCGTSYLVNQNPYFDKAQEPREKELDFIVFNRAQDLMAHLINLGYKQSRLSNEVFINEHMPYFFPNLAVLNPEETSKQSLSIRVSPVLWCNIFVVIGDDPTKFPQLFCGHIRDSRQLDEILKSWKIYIKR